jgi:large subunit ribosomal protein L21e
MLKHKRIRTKGKFSFTRFFQKFKPGDSVAVVRELSVNFGYSKRLQGRTGRVLSKQGTAYKIQISDFNKPKTYLIKPIHLTKIAEKTK